MQDSFLFQIKLEHSLKVEKKSVELSILLSEL